MSTADNSSQEILSPSSQSTTAETQSCPITENSPTPLKLKDTDISECTWDDFREVSFAGVQSGNTEYGRPRSFLDKNEKSYFWKYRFIFGPEANLSEVQLTGDTGNYLALGKSNLTKANFSNSYLDYIALYEATLDEAIFIGAELKNINADGATFEDADLADCEISQVERLKLKGAILKDFDLSQENTTYLKHGGDNSGSVIYDIDLRGANFSNKVFTEPERGVLKNVDLKHGIFEDATLDNVDLTGASLHKANLKGATLDGTKLDGAVLVGATDVVLKGAKLKGFDFEQKIDSNQLNLGKIDLKGADFSDISFENIENSELFLNLKLNNIDFTDADVSKLNLGEPTDLRGAILNDTKIGKTQNINLAGADFTDFDGSTANGTEAVDLFPTLFSSTKNTKDFSAVGIALVGNTTAANGENWQYSVDGGINWSSVPADLSETNALYLNQTTQLRVIKAQEYDNNNTALGDGLIAKAVFEVPTDQFMGPTSNPFGLKDIGRHKSPAFADIDNDGDLDAFIGIREGHTAYFKNTGKAERPNFKRNGNNPFGLKDIGWHASPAFADIDNDGDLDAFIGNFDGNTAYFENTGNADEPKFKEKDNTFELTVTGQSASPAFADIDNDGDLDAFIGNYQGNTAYFKNAGNADTPNFESSINNPFGLTVTKQSASPAFADIDNDGDLDAFIGDIDGNTAYFKNTGNADTPNFERNGNNPFGLKVIEYYAKPAFADIDNDGDLDAFIGSHQGWGRKAVGKTAYFENTSINTSIPPGRVPGMLYNFSNDADFELSGESGSIESTIDPIRQEEKINKRFFERRNLVDVKFKNAIFSDHDFSGATLTGADFTGAVMDGVILNEAIGPNLKGAKLNKFNLTQNGFEIQETNLKKADFSGSNKSTFDQYTLEEKRDLFDNINLKGANFQGLILKDISFAGANLEKVTFNNATLDNPILKKSDDLPPPKGHKTSLKKDIDIDPDENLCEERECEPYDIDLTGAILKNFNFDQGVNLGSSFTNTTFKSTYQNKRISDQDIFKGANFTDATFKRGFNLKGLNLTDATFESTEFNQVSLEDVKLAGVNFLEPRELDFTGANLQEFDLNQIYGIKAKDLFSDIYSTDPEPTREKNKILGIAITSNNTNPKDGYWQYSVDSGQNWLLLPTNLSEENALFLDKKAQFKAFEHNPNHSISDRLVARAVEAKADSEWIPEFVQKDNNHFELTDVGTSASPAFADLDNDGDLDAFIGNGGGDITYFRNNDVEVVESDEDPDTFIGDKNDDTVDSENIGEEEDQSEQGKEDTPSFTRMGNNPFGLKDVGDFASAAFADIDNDGDLDALIGNQHGNTVYFENTGKASEPKFEEKGNNPFGIENVGSGASPAFADIDNDGDLDAFIGKGDHGDTVYFENIGIKNNVEVVESDGDPDTFIGDKNADTFDSENIGEEGDQIVPKFERKENPFGDNPLGLHGVYAQASPAFADIDEDGDLDAFIGNQHGNTVYFENTGKASEPKFEEKGNNPFGLKDVGDFASAAFADIDNDGDLDALIGNEAGDIVYFENIATPRLDLTQPGEEHNFTTDQEFSLSGEYTSSTNDIPRNSLKDVDLTGENFADINLDRDAYPKEILKGYELQDSNFTDANLTRIDLSNTDLTNAILKDATLNGTKLENAANVNLSGARLNGFNFNQDHLNLVDEYSETDFTGIDFQKINDKTIFVGSTFNQTIFTNAKLDGHNLRDTSFTNIENLEKITFEKAKLAGAQFNGTGTLNLQGADLRGFNLNQESLKENGTIRLKQKLINVNLKEENISDYGKAEILQGFDLTQSNLKNSILDDLNLSNTTLNGVSFDGASLSRTTLSGATDVNLSGAKLNNFDFNQDNLDIVGNFYKTNFGNNDLENITNKNFFESQEFNASILKYASFNGHDLSNAKFIDIDDLNTISFGKLILNGETTRTRLGGAQFIGTGTLNLQGADLKGFDLNQESLEENGTIRLEQKLIDVNLQGEDFSAYEKPKILEGFDLTDSILIDTTFDGLDLTGTTLKGAQLQGASFKGTILKNTNFSDATDFNLNDADIRSLSILKFIPVETEINGVDFSGLPSEHGTTIDLDILKGRKFVNCNFEGVNLKDFDLSNTVFTDSDFKETDFEGSKLDQAKFNNPTNLDLSKANLQKFDFSQADLDIKDINFKEAKIQNNTTLQKLNLKKINFEGAKLDGANLAGADLSETNLASASLTNAKFIDDEGYRAELNNTKLGDATVNTLATVDTLEGAILSGLVAPEGFYKNLNLKNVIFTGNKSLIEKDFTGSDLSDADLSDTNLSNAKFKNSTLERANFTNATLLDTEFINSDLSTAIINTLKGANLTQIDPKNIFGRSIDLSKVNLEGQDLTGLDLTDEKLSNANLNRTILTNTILRNTDLNDASFEAAVFDDTTLETDKLTSLEDADLREFDLKQIEDQIQDGDVALTGVNLKGKRIKNINLSNAELSEAQFQGARLNDVTLSGSNLHKANFFNSKIIDSYFENEVDLDQAVLDEAEIRFSRFNDASLISASLKDATIVGGRLDRVNLESAELNETRFQNLGLQGAIFNQATLTKTVFDNVGLEQATFTDSIWDRTSIDRARDLSLKGADLSLFDLESIDQKYVLDAIKLNNNFSDIDLDGYQMKGADLSGATFEGGKIIDTDLSPYTPDHNNDESNQSDAINQESNLSDSTFKKIDLTDTILQGANLEDAFFKKTTFTNTSFVDASLKNTTFIDPIDLNLRGADLREFNISQLDLRSISLKETNLSNRDFTGFDFHNERSLPIRRHGNSEYELIKAATWQDASKAANEQGGHLLVVNSNDELKVVADLLHDKSSNKNTDIDAWIGYSQPTQDAAWQWQTESENTFQLVADISKQSAASRSKFSILQASSIAAAEQSAKDQGGQLASTIHAIPLDLLEANTKYWTNYSHKPFDQDWSIGGEAIASDEEINLLNQSISNGVQINIPDEHFLYESFNANHWTTADRLANFIYGGKLTTRTNFSAEEIETITKTTPQVIWIGLSKDLSENQWKWNGLPGPNPIPWGTNQPDGDSNAEYWGALKSLGNEYTVHDVPLFSDGAFAIAEIPIYQDGYYGILQKNNNNQLTLTSEPGGHYQGVLEIQKGGPAYAAICSASTAKGTKAVDLFPTLFNSTKKTYEKIYNQPSWISWDEARLDARNRGGYLGNITSEAELQRIIGQGIKGNYWISGIDKTSTHQYEWADGPEQGEVFWDNGAINDKYSIFRPTDPNNTNHQCVMMIGDLSLWDDLECSVKGPYLLEKDFSLVGIALVGNTTAANGEDWQYSVDGGINWSSVPSDLSETNALYLNQNAQLRVIKAQEDDNNNTALGDGLIAKAVFGIPTVPEFQRKDNDPFGFEIDGSFASTSFADIDEDGDLDAFIGNRNGKTVYFENTGQAGEPKFIRIGNNPFGIENVPKDLYGCGRAAPAFVDIDNDGDLDVFIGNCAGDTIYYENTVKVGEDKFNNDPSQSNPFGIENVGLLAIPAFADIDEDGDLDAFIGNREGNTVYFENTGKAGEPKFIRIGNNPFGLMKVAGSDSDMNGNGFAAPAFADFDEDGDLDAFIGNREGNTTYYENTGKADEEKFARIGNNPFGLKGVFMDATPAFADIDNDGDLDAFIGEWGGKTHYFENSSTPPPQRVPGMLYNFSNDADFELSDESGSIESAIDPIDPNLQDIVDTKIVFKGDKINYAIIERPLDDSDYEIDLRGANLTDTVLSGANLSYANLNNAQLKNVDFTDTILRGAKMKDTLDLDLTKADLRGFKITQVDLENTSLEEVNLSGERLKGLNLSKARLKGANLQNAVLKNANLTGIDLTNADLTGAKLQGAILKNAQINGAKGLNLQGADLRGLDLSQVELAGRNLSGANLEGQVISNTSLIKTNLTNANLKDATLSNVGLNSTTLTDADLEGATLDDVTLDGVTGLELEGSTLTGDPEALQKVSLDQIDLTQSTLKNKNFDGLNLQGLDFSGVDLTGSTFIGTRLQGAIFDGANLTNVEFSDATLKNVSITDIELENGKKLLLDDAILKDFDLSQLNALGTDQFSLIGADLSGLNFSKLDNESLKDLDFSDTKLKGASFRDTTLVGNKFLNNDLSGTSFEDATITNVNFENVTGDRLTNFKGVTFTNAIFSRSTFDASDFSDTTFNGSRSLENNVFDDSNFYHSNLNLPQDNSSDWFNITCPNGSNNQNNLFACPSTETSSDPLHLAST